MRIIIFSLVLLGLSGMVAADTHSGGFSVKLIGSDEVGWNIFTAMLGNSAFIDAVDIVGTHYPCDRQLNDKDSAAGKFVAGE